MPRYFSFILFSLAFIGLALPVLAAEREKAASDPDALFVAFEPLSVTVLKDSRVHGLLAVSLNLAVRDAETLEKARKMQPRLRDAYVQVLTRLASTHIDISRPLNIGVLDAVLQRTSDRMLGDGQTDILIQSATLRPM